ncbi:MAG: hypothetical protein ACOCQ4_01465 [bacterium]
MTEREISNFNLLLNTFNHFSEFGINEATENWILSVLDSSMPFFTHLINFYQFESLERITINNRILGSNKRIKDIKLLKYPPADKVKKYGRCNLPKQSVFYGSTMFMTAMNEMKPRVGDLITKSIWKLKEPKHLKFCPIFHIQPTNGTFNPHSWELEQEFNKILKRDFPSEMHEPIINLSKFIAFHFSKYVHYKRNKDYLFSAYFANKIMNELVDGAIDGIVYPSVQSHLTLENVVLKTNVFDENYELSEVHESIVTKDPSDNGGGYLMGGINDCKNFEYENDKILWNNNVNQPKERMDYYKEHFKIEIE